MIASMIFFPEKPFYERPTDYDFDYEDVYLESSGGVKLHSWLIHAKNPKGALLFLHGNAGNISGRLFKAKGWVDRGFSVLLVDYRGYGQSTGEIKHEDDLFDDAKAGLLHLTNKLNFPLSKIIFYGESLGTNPSTRLAMNYDAAALILEAPFTSFVELGKLHYRGVPGVNFLLKDFNFSNESIIKEIKTPFFLIHGTRDETCPYSMGEALFEKAPEPKAFFTVENGAHNDLPMIAGEDYWQKPFEFISNYLKKEN